MRLKRNNIKKSIQIFLRKYFMNFEIKLLPDLIKQRIYIVSNEKN